MTKLEQTLDEGPTSEQHPSRTGSRSSSASRVRRIQPQVEAFGLTHPGLVRATNDHDVTYASPPLPARAREAAVFEAVRARVQKVRRRRRRRHVTIAVISIVLVAAVLILASRHDRRHAPAPAPPPPSSSDGARGPVLWRSI